MSGNYLSGIERQLVLDYLIDGNVPVTLTEVIHAENKTVLSSEKAGEIKKISKGVFPVALKSEQLKVLEQGIILLQNPSESVSCFDGKDVDVQFYFNKLGLHFFTTARKVSTGLALVIPEVISRIQDQPEQNKNDFSAVIYYENGRKNGGINIPCVFDENYRLFVLPKWKDVPESCQITAKNYIEKAVAVSRKTGIPIGNGLFLLSVSRFLSETEEKKTSSIDGRAEPPKIIYIDHERIIFASSKDDMILTEGNEYAVSLSFPISGPVKERKVYISCRIEKIFESEDSSKKCACAVFTSLKEEDERFLYEKMSD